MTESEFTDPKVNYTLRKIAEALRINVTETFVIYYDDASYAFPMSECTNFTTNCNSVLTN